MTSLAIVSTSMVYFRWFLGVRELEVVVILLSCRGGLSVFSLAIRMDALSPCQSGDSRSLEGYRLSGGSSC